MGSTGADRVPPGITGGPAEESDVDVDMNEKPLPAATFEYEYEIWGGGIPNQNPTEALASAGNLYNELSRYMG